MANKLPIIISGGGIGGLATALVLAQDGHAATVLEQAAAFGEIGAGIQLGPNIFRMFDYLGLTEVINKVAFSPTGLGINDVCTGEKLCAFPWEIWLPRIRCAARAAHLMFQGGRESAGFAGLNWMYDGIEPSKLFQ